MPIEGQPLVIEKNYPNAEGLSKIGAAETNDEQDSEYAGWTMRSCFWSWHRRSDVHVFQSPEGKITWGLVPSIHSLDLQLGTLGASDAWSLETESTALQTLAGMLRHRQFRQYLLTGSFLERSQRSGVHYLFRKLRPTLAFSSRGDQMRILCALCLHPIAYYSGSWAGAMCPTDDVIAHLALMRGDEHMFWKRANQHPSWRKEAGI